MNLLLSPIFLFLTFAVKRLNLVERLSISQNIKELLIFFKSTFNNETDLQFFINILSLSFFSINLMIALSLSDMYLDALFL